MLYSARDESEEQLKYMKGLIDKWEGANYNVLVIRE